MGNLVRVKDRIVLRGNLFLRNLTGRIVLPGFDGESLYNVGAFFFTGLSKGALSTRASSIAFNFFLALFPAILFFFTMIPYIPIDGFQMEIFKLLQGVLPKTTFATINDTLVDIISHRRGGLLSFGFVAAFWFSTNGINAMITAFNATSHSIETRKWYFQRLISFLMVIIISVLLTISITLIIFSQRGMHYLVDQGYLKTDAVYYLLLGGKWIIVISMIFMAISFLYYLAPTKKTRFRFISAGSTLATILCIITSVGFSGYVNHFDRYNKLYGSIGALIVVMLWLFINALVLLIGFELNASISSAHQQKELAGR